MKRYTKILFFMAMLLVASTGSKAFADSYNYGGFTDKTFLGDELPSGFSQVGRAYMAQYFYGEKVSVNFIGGVDSNVISFGYFGTGGDENGFISMSDISSDGFSHSPIAEMMFNDIAIKRLADPSNEIPKITSSAHRMYLEYQNGEEMCAFFVAELDMYFAGLEIKKGDVVIGIERGFDEYSLTHNSDPNSTKNPIGINDADYNDFIFVVRGGKTPPVPVPAAVWLMGSGLAGIAALRRRMK